MMEHTLERDFDFTRFKPVDTPEEELQDTDIVLSVEDVVIHKFHDLTKLSEELKKVYPNILLNYIYPGTEAYATFGTNACYVQKL